MNIQYITGFFDADGSITLSKTSKDSTYRTIKIDFTNVELAVLKEIEYYLLQQGIKGYFATKPARKATHQISYALSYKYNNALKLCKLIQSKHPKKLHRINTILKYHNIVTKRNGKYTDREIERKLAYERLFFFSTFQ